MYATFNNHDIVIPAKAGIHHRMVMRCMTHAARRRSPLDPRFHGDDGRGLIEHGVAVRMACLDLVLGNSFTNE